MYPPSHTTLNRKFLCLSLFLPIGIIIVFASNFQTYLPILIVIVLSCQLAICGACIADFLRHTFPTTFTSLVSGALITFLFGFLYGAIGFGESEWAPLNIISGLLGRFYWLFASYSLYKFTYDKVACSLFATSSWERSTVIALMCPWALVCGVTVVTVFQHHNLTTMDAFYIKLCYWSGIAFAIGVFLCLRYFDNQGKIAEGQLIGIRLDAQAVANETKCVILNLIDFSFSLTCSHKLFLPISPSLLHLSLLLQEHLHPLHLA